MGPVGQGRIWIGLGAAAVGAIVYFIVSGRGVEDISARAPDPVVAATPSSAPAASTETSAATDNEPAPMAETVDGDAAQPSSDARASTTQPLAAIEEEATPAAPSDSEPPTEIAEPDADSSDNASGTGDDAASETEGDAGLEAEGGEAAPATSPTSEAALSNAPIFDVVRVEPDGSGLAAGRAAPGTEVEIVVDGKVVATATAGPDGAFVAFFSATETTAETAA